MWTRKDGKNDPAEGSPPDASQRTVSPSYICDAERLNSFSFQNPHSKNHLARERERDGGAVREASPAIRGGSAELSAAALPFHRLQDARPRPRLGRRHRQRPGRPIPCGDLRQCRGHGHQPEAARVRPEAPQRPVRAHFPGHVDGRAGSEGLGRIERRPRDGRAGPPLVRPPHFLPAGEARPQEAPRRDRRVVLHDPGGRRPSQLRVPPVLLRGLESVLGPGPEAGGRRVQGHRFPVRAGRGDGGHGAGPVRDGEDHGGGGFPHVHKVVVGVPDGEGEGRGAPERRHGREVPAGLGG